MENNKTLEKIEFEATRISFENGTIFDADNDTLSRSLRGLATKSIQNDSVRQQAIIMTQSIHSILLRRLLDEQEKKNKTIAFWFMVLAISSLLSSIIQIVVSLMK